MFPNVSMPTTFPTHNSIGQLNLPELLLGQVGVQDYGDKLNEDLRERFDVKADDFPVHLLYRKGLGDSLGRLANCQE